MARNDKPRRSYFEGVEPDTSDFQPGLLAIEELPPSPLRTHVLRALLLFLLLILVGACIGRVDITSVAAGKLIPENYVKIVQPSDAGTISAILVHDGERVRKGQVLIRLDSTINVADSKTLQAELMRRKLQLRRIQAEMDGKPLAREKDDPDDLFNDALAQYLAHRRAYEDQVSQAKATINKTFAELAANRHAQAKLEKTLPAIRTEEAAYAKLASEGYAPNMQMLEKQRARIETEQDLQSQRMAARGLASGIEEQLHQLALVTSTYRQNLQNERADADAAYKKAQQDWAKQEHHNAQMELRAPQDGIIKDVVAHTVGSVVQPGSILMTLVPEGEVLRAEVWVRNEDVGFVRKNQTVKLKFAAYPFEQYGTLPGHVIDIAADASDPNAKQEGDTNPPPVQGNAPLYYRTLVRLDKQVLTKGKSQFPLSPGMQVTADIKLKDQTLMSYFLSPLQKTVLEAVHER